MGFSPDETDYLTDILTTHLFTLLARVTRWQTHSLSQQQYDQQVAETLTPNIEKLQSIVTTLHHRLAIKINLKPYNSGSKSLFRHNVTN